MRKLDIVNKVAEELKLPKKEVKKVVDLMFEEITKAIAKGEKVEIRGLGTFKLKKRPSRFIRNPRTGVEMFVEEKYVPHFKMGKLIKRAINSKKT